MTWKTEFAIRVALAVGAAIAGISRSARGAEASPPRAPSAATSPRAPAAANALTPPKLIQFVAAPMPDATAEPRRIEAVILELELTIDASGRVTDARVAPSPPPTGSGPAAGGAAFEEAALGAARAFVFEPARRGELAIPARIKYRYTFEAPAPAAVAPTTGTLQGKVLVRGTEGAVRSVAVSIQSADGAVEQSAVTDEGGAFAFGALLPGVYRVKLSGATLSPLDATEEINAGELTSVTYRMDAEANAAAALAGGALEFGATATVEAPAREVTKRSLQAEELLRVAGTRGDPLRAIEYMPGVGRSPMANFVIIRGSSPADSEVQFEGAPVFRLYHFGGLTSFVQPRLLEKIDLYPGNFSARYGRKMGGVIDVGVRDPRTDGLHGLADVNVVDSSLLFEGPLGKNWSFAVAAKRSTIDVFIDKLVPKEEISIVAAPVYWDYQAIVAYKPTDKDRFRAMVYGSYDDFKLILANPAEADPAVRGGLSSYSGFHRGQVRWQHDYGAIVEQEISLSAGPYSFGQKLGPELSLDVPGWDAFLRAEWRAAVHRRLRIMGGLDVAEMWTDAKYNGPRVTQLDGDPDTFGMLTGTQNVQFSRSYNFFRPAAYLEAIWSPTDRLTIVPGGRVDYIGDIRRWTVDPRLTARYQVGETTTLKGGAGLFSQAPDFAEVLPVVGNPNLRAPRAQHYSAGVEQQVGARLKVTAEGFYKRLSLLTVNSPVPGENLNNDGIGRIYGAEASARLRPTVKSSGFLSYTLSRSERNDHHTTWRLFNWDQTHILTVAGAYRLGGSWDVSGTFRYVTGNPITPVVASTYNANTDTYRPLYGAVNSDRGNAFHRLDVRLEKSWAIGSAKAGKVAAYLDVQNAYNRQSEEGRVYNYNFTQSQAIPGLPIIPSVGVRGEI